MPHTWRVRKSNVTCYDSRVTEHEGEKPSRFLPGNIRRRREHQDITRRGLADAMQARGHKWHPNTVARIEDGTQIPDVDELVSVSRVLGVSIDRLMSPEGEDAEHLVAAGAITRLRQAAEAAAAAVAELYAARDSAGKAASSAARSSYPQVRGIVEGIMGEVGDSTVERAVDAGYRRWNNVRWGD